METFIENIIIYSFTAILFALIFWLYIRKQNRKSKKVAEKISKAKEEGLFEPLSLHPVVDPNSCIQTGACIAACPEKDILGIYNGKATTINTSRCIGHGACFHACPTEAISLCIGTEKRGVDLPHVNQLFETNVQGIYMAGEMGGMGLIRNAVEQGKQAVENLSKNINKNISADYDLVIIGAGPAGISASLTAKKLKLSAITLEQDSLGGTVFTFPRSKIVMTSPMDLPLHGKVKLYETNKSVLLDLWIEVIDKNKIVIKENAKVDYIKKNNGHFIVTTATGDEISARKVLLAIGRRGSPRKLNVPGEESQKVAYRLLEPENISDKKIIVIGGGDSAVEAAMQLSKNNDVLISYRSQAFSRIKPKNKEAIENHISEKEINVLYNSNVLDINNHFVTLEVKGERQPVKIENDLVYIFAGGELPTRFLEKSGIKITRKFGEAILKHEK